MLSFSMFSLSKTSGASGGLPAGWQPIITPAANAKLIPFAISWFCFHNYRLIRILILH